MNTEKLLLSTASSFAILGLTAPGSANVAPIVGKPSVGISPKANTPYTQPARALTRQLKVGHANVAITGPIGCGSDGLHPFQGSGAFNYAGGQTKNGPGVGYSSTVNGYGNESCDSYSAIVGGRENIIGGDGGGNYSLVGDGLSNTIEGQYSFIGAGNNNAIDAYGTEPSIASGIVAGNLNTVAAQYSFIGSGDSNLITGNDSTICGGSANYESGTNATIGGGHDNNNGGIGSTIAGGSNNIIYDSSDQATIGGGVYNTVSGESVTVAGGIGNAVSGPESTIAGGFSNSVSGPYAIVGGGRQNTVSGEYAIAAGGYLNTVGGIQASVGGGYGNTASGKDATVPGGADNSAGGSNSFAAGSHASSATQGSFVWSDTAVTTALTSTVANEFLARATGGFYLYSSTKGVGVKLAPGSGSWSTLSDRNVKINVQAVNPAQVLAKLDSMPVSEWSYNSEGSVRHLGPMAQDFRAAFNLGEDDKSISTVDEEGVALAAIKALKAEDDAKDREIIELREAHLDDQARLSRLENRLVALEAKSP